MQRSTWSSARFNASTLLMAYVPCVLRFNMPFLVFSPLNTSCNGADVFPLKRGRRLTCSGERTVFRDGEQAVSEKSLCTTDGPSAAHRVRENKRRCARSPDTKPGHAEIMGPAQWVANKRAALIILPHLIFTAHLKSQSGI